MQLVDNVIQRLIDDEICSKKDKDIFKEYAPKNPDDCIIVYEYAGSAPAYGTTVSVRSIQVVSRGKKQVTAKEKAWQAYRSLHQESLFLSIGNQRAIVQVRNTPIKIGTDEVNRTLFAFNVAITINES